MPAFAKRWPGNQRLARPPPDEVAAEIVEDLETALKKFRAVAAQLAALRAG